MSTCWTHLSPIRHKEQCQLYRSLLHIKGEGRRLSGEEITNVSFLSLPKSVYLSIKFREEDSKLDRSFSMKSLCCVTLSVLEWFILFMRKLFLTAGLSYFWSVTGVLSREQEGLTGLLLRAPHVTKLSLRHRLVIKLKRAITGKCWTQKELNPSLCNAESAPPPPCCY